MGKHQNMSSRLTEVRNILPAPERSPARSLGTTPTELSRNPITLIRSKFL